MARRSSRAGGPRPAKARRLPAPGQGRRAREVAEWVRQHVILAGSPGDVLPRERDLARQAGVARNTLRRALELLRREGWLRHAPGAAHVLSRPRSRLLRTTGLFFPARPVSLFRIPFYREVYAGIHQAIEPLHRQVLSFFGFGRRVESLEPSMFWSPNMRIIDSLILLDVFEPGLIEQAGRLYPAVCMDGGPAGQNVSSVEFDHPATIRMAYKYLLDLGHRRIGLVARPEGKDPAIAGRLQGFGEALQWIDAPDKPQWLYPCMHGSEAPAVVRRWLSVPVEQRPTAMVVVDVFWNLAATLVCAGVQIPRGLSLVAVGPVGTLADAELHDLPVPPSAPIGADEAARAELSRRNAPLPLTAMTVTEVRLPAREMGTWGVNEIHRRLQDRSAPPRHEVLIPAILAGDTAVPPPAADAR